MKILHLLSQRPDSTGSGIYIQAMMREAKALGHENFLVAGICSDKADEVVCIERDDAVCVNFSCEAIPFQIPGMSDVMPYASARFCDLSQQELIEYETVFSNGMQRAVDKFEPDIIHSHHLWILSSLARRLFQKIPMATSCHGSDLRQFQNCPHLQKKVLSGCRKIDHVMALTQAQKNEISRLYHFPPEQIDVVGAGYDDSLFYVEAKPKSGPVQLVYAGKLSYAKGVPWLLRALQSIDTPEWELHLLGGGSGEEKAHCLRLAQKLGKRVHTYGAVAQPQMASILRRSHLLVLPSFYEGLPLVILEGLASGCRVVVTDLPGTREILQESKADFISLVQSPRLHTIDQPLQQDETVFEKALQFALQEQMGAASADPQPDLAPVQDILDAFTWTGVFRKVGKVYRKILQPSTR